MNWIFWKKFVNNPELIMSDLSAYEVSDYDFYLGI